MSESTEDKPEITPEPNTEESLGEPAALTTSTISMDSVIPKMSFSNVLLSSLLAIGIIILLTLYSADESRQVEALSQPQPVTQVDAPEPSTASFESVEIERKGEGRHFYTTIKIPVAAETLYLSGSGASSNEDGSWGDMEQQTINTFDGFKNKLESEGWSMSDIVQVRAFAVAGEYGLLDFDGFNRGYREFFGTQENPMKPVRSFVQVADLVVPGWLIEIEVRAARVP